MSVASLAYRINADTSQLGRELRFAERRVQRFQKRAESSIHRLGKTFATMGGLAATALIATGREGIRLAADMDQAASQIGTTTEELSALKFAARENKVEFDTLQPRLERFSRQVSDAADGTGQLVDVVDDYNVELRESDGSTRSFNDILRDVADATVEAEDGFERARIAAAAFGSRGAADMIPLLMEGGDEIERLEEKARSLGLTISDETGVAAQQFQAEWRRLTDIGRTFQISLATEILPTLNAYTQGLADSAQRTRESAQETGGLSGRLNRVAQAAVIVESGVNAAVRTFLALGVQVGLTFQTLIREAGIVARTVGGNFVEMGRTVQNVWEEMWKPGGDIQGAVSQGMTRISQNVEGGLSDLEDSNERYEFERELAWDTHTDKLLEIADGAHQRILSLQNATQEEIEREPLSPLSGAGDAVDTEAQKVEARFQELVSFVESTSRRGETSLETFEREVEKLNEAFMVGAIETGEEYERLLDLLAEMHDPFGELAEEARMDQLAEDARQVIADVEGVDLALEAHLESLAELRDEGLITWSQYRHAVEMAKEGTEDLADQTEDLEEEISLSAQLGEKAVEDLASTFADVLFDPFDASVRGMVTSFADGLARMAIDAAAADIVGSLISPTGFSSGGPVQSFSTGGFVSGPGSGTSDSIPAWLSDGEYVIDAKTTSHFGADYFRSHQHAAGFASGGPVGSAPSGGGAMNVAIFDNRQSAEQWARSRRGQSVIVDAVDTGGAP